MKKLLLFLLLPITAIAQQPARFNVVFVNDSIKVGNKIQSPLYKQGSDTLSTKAYVRNIAGTKISYTDTTTIVVTPTQMMDSINAASANQPFDSLTLTDTTLNNPITGTTYYDEGILNTKSDIEGVILNHGEELWTRKVRNNTGEIIYNGTVVRISGNVGNKATIAKASYSTPDSCDGLIGVATHDISDDGDGRVTIIGKVGDINTSGYNAGDTLYLNHSGLLRKNKPSTGIPILIGYVEYANANHGRIIVTVERLDDIRTTTKTNLTGILKGASGFISTASAGTDYQAVISNLADTSKYYEFSNLNADTSGTAPKLASGQDLRDTARNIRTTLNGKQIAGSYLTKSDTGLRTKVITRKYADSSYVILNKLSTGLTNTTGTITVNLSTGVSGGQSVIGGTAASNNLTLSSTSNATKGKIIFGDFQYDEALQTASLGSTPVANNKFLLAPTFTSNTLQTYYGQRLNCVVAPTQNVGAGYGAIGSSNYAILNTPYNIPYIVATQSTADARGTGGNTVTDVYGSLNSIVTNNSSGTLTFTNGYSSISQAASVVGNGVITTYYGYRSCSPVRVGAGTLTGTTKYLFYSDDAGAATGNFSGTSYTAGTFAKSFSYYSEGGDNAFRGTVGIGLAANTASVHKLSVNGNIGITQGNYIYHQATIGTDANNDARWSTDASNPLIVGYRSAGSYSDKFKVTSTSTLIHGNATISPANLSTGMTLYWPNRGNDTVVVKGQLASYATRQNINDSLYNAYKIVTGEGGVTTSGFLIPKKYFTVPTKNKYYSLLADSAGNTLARHQYKFWDGDSYEDGSGYGIGNLALSSNSGGYSNGFGYNSLSSNTANYCNGFGYNSLSSNSGAASNGIGNYSLTNNTGDYSNGFGYYSLTNNTGDYSNGFGYYSLINNTGDYSNGFGGYALYNNTGITSNGFGYYALTNNTGVLSNGFGGYALYNNTGITSNGFGYYALKTNIGNSSNGFGHYALGSNIGDYSNGFGQNTLYYNNWANTTSIGHQSGLTFTENASSTKTFTDANVNATTKKIYVSAHGYGSNNTYKNLKFKVTSGSAPSGLINNSVYQIKIVHADTLQCVDLSTTGSGTFTFTNSVDITNSTALGANAYATKTNQVVLGDTSVTEVYTRGKLRINSPTHTGGLILENKAKVWDDVAIMGFALGAATAAPAFTTGWAGSSSLGANYFQGTVQNDIAYFNIQIPHNTSPNDSIRLHIHGGPTTTPVSTDSVVFLLTYSYAEIAGTFPSVTTVRTVIPLNGLAQWSHNLHNILTLTTGTGNGISGTYNCSIQRLQDDSSDTYTSNWGLISIDCHAKIDRLGSKFYNGK